jgi:hypothetical protein
MELQLRQVILGNYECGQRLIGLPVPLVHFWRSSLLYKIPFSYLTLFFL